MSGKLSKLKLKVKTNRTVIWTTTMYNKTYANFLNIHTYIKLVNCAVKSIHQSFHKFNTQTVRALNSPSRTKRNYSTAKINNSLKKELFSTFLKFSERIFMMNLEDPGPKISSRYKRRDFLDFSNFLNIDQ